MSDPATLAFYQREAPSYTASGAQRQARDLDAFCDRLAPGARILELGCGAGRDAAHMRHRGFAIDATDGVAAMVRKANERFALGARDMRFDALESVEEYDAIWAHASLLHCARGELAHVLASIHRALVPGGWHYANYKLGDGENRDALGRLYNFPSAQWLERKYRRAGFAIADISIYPGSGWDDITRNWIAMTVQKGEC